MGNGDKKESRKAWDRFWENDTARGNARGGCLPNAWNGIDKAQTEAWSEFASKLPRGARVLDLATGDGRVMAKLLEARRDLKPVGIDQASTLPPPPRGAKMRAKVRMRNLPFPDESFAAVTSQFGFEYGDVKAAAKEIARVTKPDAMIGLITHRADSPIVEHNRARKEQILWAIEEQDLPNKAKKSLQLRQLGLAATPEEILTAPERGKRAFGDQSAAWEIAEAIRRTLEFGRNDTPAQTAAVIDQIVGQAKNELGRIASLEMAAETAGRGRRIAEVLKSEGLEPVDRQPLFDPMVSNPDAPFATYLLLHKPH